MSRRSNPLAALLAVGCLAAFPAVDLFAQQAGTPKKKTILEPQQTPRAETKALPKSPTSAPSARGGTVQQVQGTRDPVSAPQIKRGRGEPAEAEQPEPRGARGKTEPTRPVAQPLRVQKLSPELEQILKDWEAASSKFKKLSGPFTRYRYDYVYDLEFRAEGKFAYAAPDKGAYQVVGSEIDPKEESVKKNQQGVPFELSPDDPERWVCTGTKVLKIYDKSKPPEYEEVEIPADQRGDNIIDGPLPFLFGMKAEQAKQRYSFVLLKTPPKQSPDSIWLSVTPLLEKDAVNWSKARVGIDSKTFLPIAVMLTEPGGNADTVHRFREIEVNGGTFPWFPKANPFNPNLAGYKKIRNETAPPGTATRPGAAPGAKTEAPGLGARTTIGGAGKSAPAAADRSRGEVPRTSDASAAPAKKPAKAPIK